MYQPLCPHDQASDALRHELASHHRALELYWRKQWDEARSLFEQLHAQHSETEIYGLYLQRIAEIRERPLAEEWDGVYERRTK